MGYGSIGAPIVDVLSRLGYPVAVWTRTARRIDGVESFAGEGALAAFLARSAILVCALPLTAATRGPPRRARRSPRCRAAPTSSTCRAARCCASATSSPPSTSGHLAGAALDVFETEPLPATSPLWRHPKILCTPHIAAMPRPDVAARQFLDNLRRARAGAPLVNVVDRDRGY